MVEAGGAPARIAAALEAPIRALGWLCGWLVLACVLLTFGIVLLRYGLGRSAIAGQELVLHLNAAVVLVGGAWALVRDQHVRVDIFKQGWPPAVQARAELAGIGLLLLPFALFLFVISLDYVGASWAMREGSREVGGLPGVFLVKTLIPVSALLLIAAGLARGLRMLALARAAAGPPAPAAASAAAVPVAQPGWIGHRPASPSGDPAAGTESATTPDPGIAGGGTQRPGP
jgi:TRAP-type mannitol/chloroaromatic compound transport system permease small subunit